MLRKAAPMNTEDPLVSVDYIRTSVIQGVTAPRLNRLIAAGEFPGPDRMIGRARAWFLSTIRAYQGGKTSGWSGHDAGFAERQAAAKTRTEALRRWHEAGRPRRASAEAAAA
jgi:predicted DNA-binding transcriptional regulator AlpA